MLFSKSHSENIPWNHAHYPKIIYRNVNYNVEIPILISFSDEVTNLPIYLTPSSYLLPSVATLWHPKNDIRTYNYRQTLFLF